LVVLHDTDERKGGKVVWRCRCDCGDEVDIRGDDLTSGDTTSCGCYQRERSVEANTVHGMNRRGETHPVYVVWKSMLQRCENPNASYYKNYGGRGITVCDEWHDVRAFIDWASANGWRKGLSIDRIDNNGNYEPGNCRWTMRKEQQRNKRNNRLITFNSKTQTMVQWAEEVNVSARTLSSRINRYHWPIERALTEPIRGHKHAS